MAELFRYIEQSFVIPSSTRPIDVERESDQQDSLRRARWPKCSSQNSS